MTTTARSLPVLPDAAWWAENVPCRTACPVHTDAGAYVAAIADGDFARAYRIARAPNPFPSICGRICAAPCESRCRRGALDAPIAIRALKRVVSERFGVEAGFDATLWHEPARGMPDESRGRVAVVGGGPAGLACAHDLRLAGRAVTLFEREARLGGMMVLGIPPFRLPRAVLQAEIDAVVSLGVDVRLGVQVGRDVAFDEILRDFDAVFLASGTGVGRMLDVPGRELPGVTSAVSFLARMNAGESVTLGERVVVVGGGSTAFDAARVAIRAGAPQGGWALQATIDAARAARRAGVREVTIVSLEGPTELAADAEELREAAREGIRLLHRRAVRRIRGIDGATAVGGIDRVSAVELAPVRRVFDEHGGFAPELEDGVPAETLACDTVLFAVGQEADTSWLPPSLVRDGLAAADRSTGRTPLAKVFAGGDIVRGPRIVIEAVADGRRAAAEIDGFLERDGIGRPFTAEDAEDAKGSRGAQTAAREDVSLRPVGEWERLWTDYDARSRVELPVLPRQARDAASEVERVLDAADAVREAGRCLRCHANVTLRADRCVLCGLCADVCPERCIALRPAGDGAVALSLDEARCIRCGLCVERCPADALTMVELAHA